MKPPETVQPPSVTSGLSLPESVTWVATALSGPRYGYGWRRSGSLPVRPDSVDYLCGSVRESLMDAKRYGVRNPKAWIDAAGGVVLCFENKGRSLHVGVPCAGVVLWRKTTADDTGSEGVARDYDVGSLSELFTDLFDWLTFRSNLPVVYPPKRVKRVKD